MIYSFQYFQGRNLFSKLICILKVLNSLFLTLNKNQPRNYILTLHLMYWLVFSFSVKKKKRQQKCGSKTLPSLLSNMHTCTHHSPGQSGCWIPGMWYFKERNSSVIIECFLLFFLEKVSNDRSSSNCIVYFPSWPF